MLPVERIVVLIVALTYIFISLSQEPICRMVLLCGCGCFARRNGGCYYSNVNRYYVKLCKNVLLINRFCQFSNNLLKYNTLKVLLLTLH